MSARERKVITVLFADLVSFTSRSEKLDPDAAGRSRIATSVDLRSDVHRKGAPDGIDSVVRTHRRV